jgi:transposase
MSDRFDHTFDHKLERKLDGPRDAAVDVRRIELITGTGRRRRWAPDVKARILLESLEPGANISDVARRHGLNPQQLFGWRHQARVLNGGNALAPQLRPRRGRPRLDRSGIQPTGPSAGQAREPLFAPVVVGALPVSAPVAPGGTTLGTTTLGTTTLGTTTLAGTIEIVIGDAIVRVGGQVDAQHIAAVLSAIRRST